MLLNDANALVLASFGKIPWSKFLSLMINILEQKQLETGILGAAIKFTRWNIYRCCILLLPASTEAKQLQYFFLLKLVRPQPSVYIY